MAEPGIGQRRELLLGQRHRRGDEARIEPDIARPLNEQHQILPRDGLAAREMDQQRSVAATDSPPVL